uniref:Conotoxin Rg9.1 n=1 Tax=Conus regius TaxID=101314 RepID=CP91_CONRE|nr:RecName: Full=Conotoxin Rg9.1; Flags: Precursor [Conus regius]AAN06008.1 Rg9.1 precursor [Conus regius]
MHLSLARSAVLILLLLFALGNFVGVQPGQITRDADHGINLRSLRKQMSRSPLVKGAFCGQACSSVKCPKKCFCHPEEKVCYREMRTKERD